MSCVTNSVCKLCRRENMKLFLKGDRCFSDKCAFDRRPYPPGQHGQSRLKFSEFALQLREKQKAKRYYGLSEKQFRKYVVFGHDNANGISTASGGVCANVVGTKPDGSTSQVPPTQVGSTSLPEAPSTITNSSGSDSPTATSQESAKPTAPPSFDYSPYGIGKPFTQKIPGSVSAGQCPSGFQAASNFIPGVGPSGVTECWPENAWAAYSIGGDVWQKFKTSNGSWACLGGAEGPTASNRVLIAQMTTDGIFSFELNIQIGTPGGGVEQYVAKNPIGDQKLFKDLIYSSSKQLRF